MFFGLPHRERHEEHEGKFFPQGAKAQCIRTNFSFGRNDKNPFFLAMDNDHCETFLVRLAAFARNFFSS
jgi:hypothetical protein